MLVHHSGIVHSNHSLGTTSLDTCTLVAYAANSPGPGK